MKITVKTVAIRPPAPPNAERVIDLPDGAMVAEGQIHYFIGGGRGGMVGDRTDQPSAQIRTWVEETFTARTVDGATVYDLTAPADGR